MSNDINNEQVLQLIFGEMWHYAHVTSFQDDPGSIANDRRAICWAGDYYTRFNLESNSNQFFCVSLFGEVDGRSRRRKNEFAGTYVIGLDDVVEKLPPERVNMLPQPTYKMRSSLYSEQWFYVLNAPEMNRDRVDNLLDQLIANGLAPDGNDPGMKGVTRYLRLPEGVNTKAKRIAENNGIPPKCQVTEWNPHLKYNMEDLAKPFNVDLSAPRRQVRTAGSVDYPDHPVMKQFEIKQVLGPGRYDVTCPWVEDHTNQEDNGSAIFTNNDGSIGFQCHHGHCQGKTARDVIDYLDEITPGFRTRYNSWRTAQSLKIFDQVAPPPEYDFMYEPPAQKPTMTKLSEYDFMGDDVKKPVPLVDYQRLMNDLRHQQPSSDEQLDKCETFLRVIDSLPHAEKLRWYDEIQQVMGWSKSDLTKTIADYRKSWYQEDKTQMQFYGDMVFVVSMNQFYHFKKNMFLTPEAFQNAFCHLDDEARKTALQQAKSKKVDMIDYVPGKPRIFEEDGIEYVNSWEDNLNYGTPGPSETWLKHWEIMGWEEYRDMHLKFMAHTIRKPEIKINWAPVMAGKQGAGKDFLIYPLVKAMGRNAEIVDGIELTSQFNEYLHNHKYIHFNEVELGDHNQNREIANKLKPIVAAPPMRVPLNIKGHRRLSVKNVFNVTISSNSYQPLYTDRDDRRYYMTWTDFNPRNEDGQVRPEWEVYWRNAWYWMLDESEGGLGGWRQCVYHMVHAVDLSGFNPRSAPPVTDYMKQVQQLSKSPTEVDVESLIEQQVGVFACDLVTIEEAQSNVRMYSGNSQSISKAVLTRVLSSIGARGGMTCMVDGRMLRVIAIRKAAHYLTMSDQQLQATYIAQHKGLELPGKVTNIR